ncbi:MAG TPA: hypothetical protein VMS75_12705, partial [Terriglobales bacterium]|nr:hypothetical protein [Terriglobales bacterium]
GISAYWSDMLGTHTIITTAITGPQIIDTSGVVAYLNSKKRLNWGAALSRIVYPYPYYSYGTTDFGGETVLVELQDIFRIINYDVSAFASYPLSSAQRVELSGGYRYLDFNETLYTRYYTQDGYLVYYEKSHPPTIPGFGYGYVSAGLYYDTGIFGATSPLIGQSYGLGVSPAFGGLNFTSVSVDLRKYIIPVKPFTLAFRALHLGRYGKDAEDYRMFPLYLGYWDLVRGYDYYSYYSSASTLDIGRLFGSKMIVANVELRFPILRLLGLGKGYFGAWPLEAYGFYDAGIAWANTFGNRYYWGGTTIADVKPWFLNGNRKPLTSAGFGLRTNLFGMLVLGLNYVYPFQDRNVGWHFQFYISPGF